MACKHKAKPSLSGEEPVEVGDFVSSFQEEPLPFRFDDLAVLKKDDDSFRISYKVFTQFIPDTIVNRFFGKGIKPRFYPMGRVSVPKGETYLFVKAVSGEKKLALLAGFDKKEKFIAAMIVLQPDQYVSTQQVSGIDKKFSVFKNISRKNPDGTVSEGKDVYILNEEGKNFMLIVTEPLDKRPPALINPIDTLPRKHKWSADYAIGKNNLVSVRDAKRPNHINFFIHFEKENGDCIGELKGEAILRSPSMAEYRSNVDPCVLQLHFTSSSVSINEVEGCGSHRGLHCFFEGTYPRKKEIKHKKNLKSQIPRLK